MQTLQFLQNIREIETTPEELGLLVGGKWLRCPWKNIQNASLLRKRVMMMDPVFPSSTLTSYKLKTPEEAIALMERRRLENNPQESRLRMSGVSTREILSFRAFDRRWSINVSTVGSHFENNELLRSILLSELRPVERNIGIWTSPFLWIGLAVLSLLILNALSVL